MYATEDDARPRATHSVTRADQNKRVFLTALMCSLRVPRSPMEVSAAMSARLCGLLSCPNPCRCHVPRPALVMGARVPKLLSRSLGRSVFRSRRGAQTLGHVHE